MIAQRWGRFSWKLQDGTVGDAGSDAVISFTDR